MVAARVLVVEDDPIIGAAARDALAAQGYDVEWARTGAAALDAAAAPPDLVLLDLGLPDLDGVEVCRRLRAAAPQAVIVMLTARSDEVDIVVGLDAGADDYLTKPVRLAELLARVRAHLRRGGPPPAGGGVLTVGDLTVDAAAHRATVGGHELELRPREFDLLATLAAHAGEALTRERLMAEVWDTNWFGATKTLDMHVSALRRKLGERDGAASRITTLRGVGYRLEAGGAASARRR